jgi:hypothetical protein
MTPVLEHPEVGELECVLAPVRETCHYCGAEKLRIPRQRFEIGDQIWSCLECGLMRAWGFLYPEDRLLRPALNCAKCEAPTRHRFAGVA